MRFAAVAVLLAVGSSLLLAMLSGALVIARVRRDRREVRQRAAREAMVAALGSDATEAVRAVVVAAARDARLRADLVEVFRMVSGAARRVRDIGDRALAEAAAGDTRHRDAARRALGAELLAQIGSEEDLADVDAVLRRDPDLEARRVAARGLARRGDAESAWLLIGALVDHSLPEDRILEQLGHPFASETLVDALHLEQLRKVHAELVAALGLARDSAGVFAVARMLQDGTDRERAKACRALGRIGRHEVVPFLIVALGDGSAPVRAIAARALGEIADVAAVDPLSACLTDAEWWVRANAAESLRRCGPLGIEALVRALESSDAFARDRATEVLALHRAARERHAA